MLDCGEIKCRFTYHAPKTDRTSDRISQVEKYALIRDMAAELAQIISDNVPDCREADLAYIKLEECVMWANAGIARRS